MAEPRPIFVRGRVFTDLYHTLPLKTRDELLRLGDRMTSRAKATAREERRLRRERDREMRAAAKRERL